MLNPVAGLHHVNAFSGGLIGPPGTDLAHEGDLAGTPAFFGSSDPDPHVPWQRVEQSARIFAEMGAAVTSRRYVNRPHTIFREELDLAKCLIHDAYGRPPTFRTLGSPSRSASCHLKEDKP
jgi:phospholipase/carboxylesterase